MLPCILQSGLCSVLHDQIIGIGKIKISLRCGMVCMYRPLNSSRELCTLHLRDIFMVEDCVILK